MTGLLVVLALAAWAEPAQASRIVYVCGDDLCAVEPATGVSARLTSDGATAPYRNPSISRDGQRVAASRGDDVVVGAYFNPLGETWTNSRSITDVALSPDGAAVAESHSYVENRYGCPLTGGCLELVDRSSTSFTPGPGAGSSDYSGGGGTGFLGAGSLLSSYYVLSDKTHRICVVATPGVPGAECEPRIHSPTSLSSPDGSADGRLIAATVSAPAPSEATSVVLFDAASGAAVRELAAGGSPAFSPDGAQVAYAGTDGWVYTVAARGGAARKLVQGHSPAWGGGDGPGPRLASTSLRLRKGRIAVPIACGQGAACRGTVRLRKGKRTIGSRSYRIAANRRATLQIAPKALAGAKRQRVAVVLAPRGARTTTQQVTLRR